MNDVQAETAKKVTDEIISLKKEIGSNIWEIGVRLKGMKESSSYKVLGYDFWQEYCEYGLDISQTTAAQFIRISSEFDSHSVVSWGVKKLDLLLRLEPSERKTLMQTIKPDTPASVIEDEIKVVKGFEKADKKLEGDDWKHFWSFEHEALNFIDALNLDVEKKSALEKGYEMLISHPHFKDYPNKNKVIKCMHDVRKLCGRLQ